MFKKFLAGLIVAGVVMPSFGAELTYDWGTANVIADHMVGPGMHYKKIIYPKKPLILWLVTVDLTNPYAKIEQVQSRHQVPDPLRWDVMTHYKENSRPGHQVKVAWNHDFFSYDASVCIGVNISEGEVTWTKTGRSLLAVTEDRSAHVFYPAMDSYVTAPDGTRVDIDYYNALYGGIYGDCVLYNRLNSKTLTEEGHYIALQPLDKWTVNGDPIRCRVLEISDTPLNTTADGTRDVLYLRNSKLNALDGHLNVGDILTVTQNFSSDVWGDVPNKILNAFHGYPSIVHDGVLHEGEYNNFENGREYEKSSRVMVGVSKDKKRMLIATTEMSGQSLGVDCIELSAFLVENGAWDVVNWDSGGSAAIVIDGEMLNIPGRGSVRPVQDAALAVSLAPEDNTVDHLSFSLPEIRPMIISRTPLKVMSFNQYDEILDGDLQGCTFTCEPESMGYVDDNAIFHSSDVCTEGRIIAAKDGKVAELRVSTLAVDNVTSTISKILVDDQPHVLYGIKGESANGLIDVDAGALTWTSSPEGIAEVNDGIIRGIANGHTTITGAFHDLKFDIDVTVEIPEKSMKVCNVDEANVSKAQVTSTVKNLTYDNTDVPASCKDGVNLNFDLSTGRSSNIKITPARQLYSIPDSISIAMNDRNSVVNKVTFNLTDANGDRYNLNGTANGDIVTVSFRDGDNSIPFYKYPLTLNTVTFYLINKNVPEARLSLGDIMAYYPGYTGVSTVTVDSNSTLTTCIEGESLKILYNTTTAGTTRIDVYSATGSRLLATSHLSEVGQNTASLNMAELSTGIYIVSAHLSDGSVKTAKLILR